jgi:hypothetical protein
VKDAAWLDFWASKMTSDFKNLKLRRRSYKGDTSAFSCPSFTVNWIWSRWFVFNSFYFYLALNLYSIGDGANTGTEMYIRRCLGMQRELHTNLLMRAQLTLSNGSSTNYGGLWTHIRGGSLGRCVTFHASRMFHVIWCLVMWCLVIWCLVMWCLVTC